MEISPRYGGEPVIAIVGRPDDVSEPTLRQRRRLLATLRSLTDEQWRAPSRCAGWTAQDVANHLVTVDRFWAASILGGLAGEPTRMLVGFDPKASPAALADAMRALTPAETLAQLTDATTALCAAIESLDDAGWQTIGESPAGHVPIRVVAHHALWDAWVHERDVLLPLGLTADEEADEIVASLRYAAALSPAFALTGDAGLRGSIVLELTDRPERIVADVADRAVRVHDGAPIAEPLVLRGAAVDLLEILSTRALLDQPVAAEHRWLVTGLADVFEVEMA